MESTPVKYLVMIETQEGMTARFFDAQRHHMSDIDASSEEVVVMLHGLVAEPIKPGSPWLEVLSSHNPQELAEAKIYTLEV
jgi:hypothetical protein